MDNPLAPIVLMLALALLITAILAFLERRARMIAQREITLIVAQQTRANPLLSTPEAHSAQGG
jgi:hypothetical protein